MHTRHIQRTFSLRARSQPPPEVQETMWKPIGSTNLLSRSPAYLTNYPIQQLQYQTLWQIQQTVQSLEDEHRALQYEYDRLRQKSATPTNNISGSYGTMNRLQYSQQRVSARIPHQNPLLYPQPFQSTEIGRRSSSGGNNKNDSKNCSGSVGQLSGTFNEPNQFYDSTKHVTQRSYSERSAENHMQSLSHPRDSNISTDVPQRKSELKQQ
ncbi:hypothetical protein MN116_001758 [Schistosoma mekongi]|uniref:Uncharacterized protein n=1 Tax=Schistosoma mekongi TaxID=38744 RepID=A0AAE1ZJW2_SCHME|nr:hypothetical protein MN116_001758 [Schistosoma mekongi]